MASESNEHASRCLEILPDYLLDDLVFTVLKLAPSLRSTFLTSLGSRLHTSAVRVLFSTISIPDDARLFGSEYGSPHSIVSPLLSNAGRYSPAVKSLIIRDPDVGILQKYGALDQDARDATRNTQSPEWPRPIDAHDLSRLLGVCSNLESFIWLSSIPPPDGLCEMLITASSRITRVSLIPRPSSGSLTLPKWDAPSLRLLTSLPLTSLHLSRLSQCGARTLSVLLSHMGEYSTLEDLSFDFVWLDDQLCEMIAKAGSKLRKLRIGTSGTKLTDKGVAAILDGCDALEELAFDEVQGRLSRSLWTKLSAFPPGLKNFRVVISEVGPHHSWMKDHLQSLHALPFETLRRLSIVRREGLPRLQNGVPAFDSLADDVVALKPVPKEFLDNLKDAKSLVLFECDWWCWSVADVKVVLESCPHLETIKLCLDAPVQKLLGLTSAFATPLNLQTLSFSVNPVHAPGKPPVPVTLFSQSTLPTPRESPALKAKCVLPQLLDYDQMNTQTCRSSDLNGDPSMPLLRDVKRFVRKCPKLEYLEWYGKAGRGSWSVSRPSNTTSKISINVSVEYNPPMIAEDVWKKMMRERDIEDAVKKGWNPSHIERVGQSWTGDAADALETGYTEKDKDKEGCASPTEKDKQGRSRDGMRKARLSSVSTSSFSSSGTSDSHACQQQQQQLPTPTRTGHPQSPLQPFTPLTPSHSETSVSTALSSVSESVESGSLRGGEEEENEKVSGSVESGAVFQKKAAVRGRPRMGSGSTVREGGSQGNGAASKGARGSGGAARSGRGRGRGRGSSTGGGKKFGSGEGEGANGTGRGKSGRGFGHGSTHNGGDRSKRTVAH